MLTATVNIAVFAALRFRAGSAIRSHAEFKPVCGPHELDIARYGRQKWQDRGKKWQWMAMDGKVGGKNGKV